MKRTRDMDLIRSLMLEIENGKDEFEPSVEEADRLDMHLELIQEADFAVFVRYTDGSWAVSRLTGKGHDFLDSVRDPKIWAKTKDGAVAAGGWTLSLLGDLAKGFARQQIAKHTGIDI